MRAFLLTAALLLASTLSQAGGDEEIVRVWPEYRSAESFERISEYFGGTESHPGRTILRSQPEHRAGYYFLVRLKSARQHTEGKRWRIQIVSPGSDKILSFSFPFDSSTSRDVTELGLTGTDWSDPKANPNAWRITLLAADGRELLARQSFLWR